MFLFFIILMLSAMERTKDQKNEAEYFESISYSIDKWHGQQSCYIHNQQPNDTPKKQKKIDWEMYIKKLVITVSAIFKRNTRL